jgi:hypothetical protein
MAVSVLQLLLSVAIILPNAAAVFRYNLGTATQCGSLEVQFQQGTGPYRFVVVPVRLSLKEHVVRYELLIPLKSSDAIWNLASNAQHFHSSHSDKPLYFITVSPTFWVFFCRLNVRRRSRRLRSSCSHRRLQ